jgi:hypothetical protein
MIILLRYENFLPVSPSPIVPLYYRRGEDATKRGRCPACGCVATAQPFTGTGGSGKTVDISGNVIMVYLKIA